MFRREHHSPTSTESAKYSPTVSVRRRWKYRKEEVEATTVQSSLWIRVGSIISIVSLSDLRKAPSMINPAPEHVTWYYGEWQSAYENLDIPNLRLEQGLPTAFDTGKRNVVVLDELMAETDGRVTDLFTKKSHHSNTSVIYLVQNLFPKHKESRTISLKAQYMVVFNNPRDALRVTHLAKQMYPGRVKFVQEAFKDATSVPYGYLLVDLKQDTPEDMRLRTTIIPDDTVQCIYVPKL